MEKIYAAPISGDWYAVFVGDKKLTLPLSESDAKKIADRYNGFEELERENKRLALQVEVLSAAFANSSEKEKSLMAEKEKLRDALKIAIEDVDYISNGTYWKCIAILDSTNTANPAE